jgi:3-hydroxyisobutyrate dehydrogenase-like beta-hydroxyacid dehydrogenase
MPAGLIAVHSTVYPNSCRELASATAAALGVSVIDAPVSGGPHDAAAGTLTLFVGGSDDTVAGLPAGIG